MSESIKKPITSLGYNYVSQEFIPKGKNEYYLRSSQNQSGIHYRHLTAAEKKSLISFNNTSANWNDVLVCDGLDTSLIKNCTFFGLVRIGKLEKLFLQHHDIRQPVGLYNSTIISCDFGNNVVVNNVAYLSHFIIGNEVVLTNINEMATSDYAKFGNGIVKAGEEESVRIWLEVCNENTGRKIMPFNGMLPGDAYLWSRYRDDEALMKKFKSFTEKIVDKQRGYYGIVGDKTVIKNCGIIKDIWVGSHAYFKGVNKLKNLTINSDIKNKTQIGEGCELVNGIIGFGCHIFYGAKAVRFILSSNSHLKYGARLINSYLGNNSTISCCEVLNSLIFPAHEQHHNNSFLCASMIMGQSNIAAGATIGSNHNGRGADGELIAGRGFWPGLCVSLKHNSKFASFTILSKSAFQNELNIPIPFSLASDDVSNGKLVVIPAYWFLYNMYALVRNETKYRVRDLREDKTQTLEYNFLAPDSINEIFTALKLLKQFTGKAFLESKNEKISEKNCLLIGEKLLEEKNPLVDKLEILAEGFENSKRQVQLIKVAQAYSAFKDILLYYGASSILQQIAEKKIKNWNTLLLLFPTTSKRNEWINVGGQLIPKPSVTILRKDICSGKIKSWNEVHNFYSVNGKAYQQQKFEHALSTLFEITGVTKKSITAKDFKALLVKSLAIKSWMAKNTHQSKAKDFKNPFRKMVYETNNEMKKVLGSLDENTFIIEQKKDLEQYKMLVKSTIKQFTL